MMFLVKRNVFSYMNEAGNSLI